MIGPARHPDTETPRRGFALLAVLWVVLVAGLMLLGLRKTAHANLAMAHNELESVRAHWLARAGVERAIATLEDDDAGSDGAPDIWYSDPDTFEKIELAGGKFSVIAPPSMWDDPRDVRYGLVDHCARVNVNVADANQLQVLCDLAEWQAESIMDWRDGDDRSRPGGAESGFYLGMKYPYLIRNGALQTPGELLLIRGIDQYTFAGEDLNLNGVLDVNEDDQRSSIPDDDGDGKLLPGLAGLTSVYSYELNRDAYGGERVNVNDTSKQELVETFNFTDALADAMANRGAQDANRPRQGGRDQQGPQRNRFNSLMDLLNVRAQRQQSNDNSDDDEGKVKEITLKWLAEHLDELTLTDDERIPGRINVNTAPREVLQTLPQMTSTAADAIVRRQVGGEGPFESVGELLSSKTLTEDQFKSVAERMTVRSSVFEIRSVGVTNRGIKCKIVAVVDRGADPMTILYWYQSE